ncbi:MAG: AmmeMemoRadiSam system protein B [Anaerolineae bacterium]|nr:AmmeMemoRadiSam system protein B [Anaerolineae bacterium]
MSEVRVRQPRFADGMWYSSDTLQLKSRVQDYLDNAPESSEIGQLMGLVAPHAGHYFSGHVAGAGFARLTSGAYETVVLIGPDHRGAAFDQIATPEADVWRTPLGDIPVNQDFLAALQTEISLKLIPRDNEHSLEIELPFLQMTLQKFKLVPLMMGDQSPEMCRQLAAALVKIINTDLFDSTLLVASSDLSHFFDDATARQLDQNTIQYMLNMDGDGLAQHAEAGRIRGQPLACGAGPVATVIHASRALGATKAHLLKYATSADVHPDKSRVVGYAAVAFGK